MGKLTATAINAAKEPGRYGDGDGLYLVVGKHGGKSWVVRVQKDGKRRDFGLGGVSKVPLKLARERAVLVRQQVEVGIDPAAERKRAAGIPTFAEAAALVDALMQGPAAELVREAVLKPLETEQLAKKATRAAKAAATKVEFFTMARGED